VIPRIHGCPTASAWALLLCAVASTPAEACSPVHRYTPEELVGAADGIYRVRADNFATSIAAGGPEWRMGPETWLHFTVLESLAGPANAELLQRGELAGSSDRNDHPVPYGFVRPGGRHGNCFAYGYATGRQYLLFLREGSVYWAPLAPANEQVDGVVDPWVRWVRTRLRAQREAGADPTCAAIDPQLQRCPAPTAGWTAADDGELVLAFTVRPDGVATGFRIVSSGVDDGSGVYAAIIALQQWRWQPTSTGAARTQRFRAVAATGQ
jgi:hypothetical protein